MNKMHATTDGHVLIVTYYRVEYDGRGEGVKTKSGAFSKARAIVRRLRGGARQWIDGPVVIVHEVTEVRDGATGKVQRESSREIRRFDPWGGRCGVFCECDKCNPTYARDAKETP